ncbi:MAG TPA: FAD-dependent oxidoreductase [Propylenella sp.]|nr:FAD-dependent oxidoreductase [Propylenella sp.]
MEAHARVVVIGGGVVGCSILYHLAKFGWTDVVLLERNELTSGSTWHAAGVIHTINADPNIARLQGYTINLYKELEELTGQSCGIHRPGGIYLASTPERHDYLKQERAKARYMGLETDFISLEHARDLNPLIDPSKYLGALFEPVDGHVDPSGVTQAYAQGARHYGARVYRHTPVIETNPLPGGGWEVVTLNGTIRADILVNAAGLWAREIGRLAGIDLPVQPMEHHYLITETIPEVRDHGSEVAVTVDYEGNAYTRQEHDGLLLGTYETNCVPWAVGGTPLDFGHELLQEDLARVSERLETAFDRMPALGRAGIRKVINGPFTFGPDGNPLIGPVPGLENYWAAVGVMAGFCQGGGVGLCMAEWLIDGEPSIDVWGMDVARFGQFATRDWGTVKSAENYSRRFILTFPNETLPAGRRQKTTALYDRLIARGAVMGVSFGLEHALWFAGGPEAATETPTFRRSNAFPFVAEEVRAVRSAVGLIEIANYAKHEVSGPGAEEFLDRMLANRLPKAGRLALTPMLTPKGKLYGDLTVARLGDDRFMLFGSSAAQNMHRRWFEMHLPQTGVAYRNLTDQLHGLAIAGPMSRELLSRVTREDVSGVPLKFRDVRPMVVGNVPVLLARVSFSGELGFELYCAPHYQLRLFEALEDAGRDLGLKVYGGRALMSMRLEKNWGVWTLDYRPDFTPAEAGLDAYIAFDKPADFIGKSFAIAERDRGPARKLVTLVVATEDVDCVADEPIFADGKCVGYVTSGGYGHSVGKSLAMGYVPASLAADGTPLQVELLGSFYDATVTARPSYDPDGARMRA